MGFDLWFAVLVALALFLIGRLAFALWRGRLWAGGELRKDSPDAFRRELAIEFLIILFIGLGLLLVPPPGEGDPSPYDQLVVLAVVPPMLIRHLLEGEAAGFRRDDRPGAYWSVVLVWVLVFVIALTNLYRELTTS